MAKKMKNVVLTFHNVTDAIWFEKTIQLIGRFFTYGTLDQLYNRLTNGKDNTPRNMCFITFDDGERSVYEVVYPIIKRLHIPISAKHAPVPLRMVQNALVYYFRRLESSLF